MQRRSYIEHILEKAIWSHETCVTLRATPSEGEVRLAIRSIMRRTPDIFWFDYQYRYDEKTSCVQLQYTFSADKTRIIRESINDVIENDFCLSLVKKLPLVEQIAYVYKWLATNCNYSIVSPYNQTIYSVFIHRKSVCTGYAKAAQFLFDRLNIESRIVYGRLNNDTANGRHCWNMVKADNVYYHFDACFSDCVLNDVARNAGVKQFLEIDGINYNFLCISTEEVLKTRNIEEDFAVPECPNSWSKEIIEGLSRLKLSGRDCVRGALLSNRGCSADVYLCSKHKNVVLKCFKSDNKDICRIEYQRLLRTRGCTHVLQCIDQYTDVDNGIIALEQETPMIDLLYSKTYEFSFISLLRMCTHVAEAWIECKSRDIVYRDIHLGNIYHTDDGIFKLGDMGSCASDFDKKCTEGNPLFMAPEVVDFGVFTEASAVYSISMLMYFILNGMQPLPEHNGGPIPAPKLCQLFSARTRDAMNDFFSRTIAFLLENRISNMETFISQLRALESGCDIDDISRSKIDIYSGGLGYKKTAVRSTDLGIDSCACTCAISPSSSSCERPASTCILSPSLVESFTRAVNTKKEGITSKFNPSPNITYAPNFGAAKTSFWQKIFRRKKSDYVFSSIFAPAEVRKGSFLQIQVYLHLEADGEKIRRLARESDAQAERRDYIPLSLKLNRGDRVDVKLSIYGASRLMSEHKSMMIWQGSFTKSSFSYYIPQDIDADELNCEVLISINSAVIGEMRFITRIVDAPRNLNTEIVAKRFHKIFISYAHEDAPQIKFIAMAYKAQGVEYFFDRHVLVSGDVYEEKIFDFIDMADLFILCWSQNAAKSDYVNKEKKRAMLHAYPQRRVEDATIKICPISIAPKAELPDDMKAIYTFEEI